MKRQYVQSIQVNSVRHLRFLAITFILLIGIMLSVSPLYAALNDNKINLANKHVLYLNSYSPSFETFSPQVDGIKSIFSENQIKLDIEFMDTKRLNREANITHFDQLFSYKLSQLDDYDAVIVADDNATNYLMEKRSTYFPDTPIVFLGVNSLDNAKLYSQNPMVTGVVEEISMADTLAMARQLNPKAKRIVALADNTTSGTHDLSIFYQERSLFSDMEMTHIDLSEMTFANFADAISKLGPEDIIIRLTTYRDITGTTISFSEGLKLVLENVNQPVYHTYYWGIPDGLIGGKIVSHFEQGVTAAKLVTDVLNGADISQIPLVENSPNKYMVNYNVLKAYGYDESLLPKGTQLLGKEMGFFQQYRQYILATIFILMIQGVIIFYLVLNVRKRKKIEFTLLKNKQQLVQANDELSANNKDLTTAFDNIREQEEHIYRLINIDNLTGLKNRFSISETIDNAIKKAYGQEKLAILFLDVDNFKNINDTHGHDMGDRIIKATGELLNKYVSDKVHIGRFGGDEFIFCVHYDDSEKELDPLIQEIQSIFLNPITIDQNSFYFTVSIGVALFPEHAPEQRELIQLADLALYEAKARGRNTIVYFNDSMNNTLSEKMDFQNAVRDGFSKGEFRMNYQPYIDLGTGKVTGLEALIRWNSPILGQVSPYRLISAAEEMGFIVELGQWIFQEACKFAKMINESADDPIMVSINVSPLQIMDQYFSDTIFNIISEVGIAPKHICLEVTETVLLSSMENSRKVFEQFQEYGIRIALDDFGTGYSSLSYFKELSFDILKIDKSFVDNITSTDYEAYLSRVMITLAHMKSLRVVAEGVEEQSQQEVLSSFNCDMVQGYYYSVPLESKDVKSFIDKYHTDKLQAM
ncbi:ABC transporter substrate binding protein [Vibrio sp. RC27]